MLGICSVGSGKLMLRSFALPFCMLHEVQCVSFVVSAIKVSVFIKTTTKKKTKEQQHRLSLLRCSFLCDAAFLHILKFTDYKTFVSLFLPAFSFSLLLLSRDHTECPVSACSCKCMQLDTTGNLIPAETVQV